MTLVLVGVAMLTGDRFPRWAGVWAVDHDGGLSLRALRLLLCLPVLSFIEDIRL